MLESPFGAADSVVDVSSLVALVVGAVDQTASDAGLVLGSCVAAVGGLLVVVVLVLALVLMLVRSDADVCELAPGELVVVVDTSSALAELPLMSDQGMVMLAAEPLIDGMTVVTFTGAKFVPNDDTLAMNASAGELVRPLGALVANVLRSGSTVVFLLSPLSSSDTLSTCSLN